MAAMNFPSSPVNGQTYTNPDTGVTYTYNSAEGKWKTSVTSNAFLPLSGGTLTGALVTTAGTASTPALQPTGDTNTGIFFPAADTIAFAEGGAEAARIDSSGRLLVGTASARSIFFNGYNNWTPQHQIETAGAGVNDGVRSISFTYGRANGDAPIFCFAKHRSDSVGGTTVVANGDGVGVISFSGSDGSEFVEAANIAVAIDGTPGSNDMPGRLVFSTTADGASSPTERFRVTAAGDVLFNTTNNNPSAANVAGVAISSGSFGGYISVSRDSGAPCEINRKTNDGILIEFKQDGTAEGTISVSGTTVSYNGAHLSRWSQLPGGAERTEILRGTVLSNIDEMCGWGEEENEQLNRMKVSDIEGDPNVSGVFQAWDDDDDTYTDDFYCAMTGDFIIRIAEGVTVQRGDLLMSAGDGTAKPQGDDIIRSKTIAKVTSTHVTCTYDDGSYCVPCVLMAC